MKIAVLLLACLVVCQGLSIQEHLTKTQFCLPQMKGNGICDRPCNTASEGLDGGDCCFMLSRVWDGTNCVASST
jgi:hypothetical protein